MGRRGMRAKARVYPRVCGGTICLCRWASFLKGLSPRVRGNPQKLAVFGEVKRSIPACAGEPADMGLVY